MASTARMRMPAEPISCGVALPRATASWALRIRSGSICCSADEGTTARQSFTIGFLTTEGALSLSSRAGGGHEGRTDAPRCRPLGHRLSTRAFAPRLRRQPEKAEARAHRALPTTCGRSPDTDRGFGRGARRPPAGREDPPYRRVERLGEGTCPSTRRRQDRLRPELLQSPRQSFRRADRYVRRCQHRLYTLVPIGSWQARQP